MWTGNKNKTDAQCMECRQVLSSSSMNPAKLRIHLMTKHPHLEGICADYFKGRCDELVRNITGLHHFVWITGYMITETCLKHLTEFNILLLRKAKLTKQWEI